MSLVLVDGAQIPEQAALPAHATEADVRCEHARDRLMCTAMTCGDEEGCASARRGTTPKRRETSRHALREHTLDFLELGHIIAFDRCAEVGTRPESCVTASATKPVWSDEACDSERIVRCASA